MLAIIVVFVVLSYFGKGEPRSSSNPEPIAVWKSELEPTLSSPRKLPVVNITLSKLKDFGLARRGFARLDSPKRSAAEPRLTKPDKPR